MTNNNYFIFVIATIFFQFWFTDGFADTLVDEHQLHYHSAFEEQVYHTFFDENNKDYFALYISMDSTADENTYRLSKTAFQVLVDEFKDPSFQKMKKSKLVKKIYNSIHAKLLDKYTIQTDFASIFSQGEYQCVTGSMLFALVFDELKIPYEIKLLPDHAYIIAYPETEYILVETTNPVKGTFVFNDQFKNNFVEYLRDSKLISKEEYSSTSKNDLFDKYYNKPEVINKKQLAGAQYRNMAFAALEQMDYLGAYHSMEKAYLFHPNQNNSYLLLITLASSLEKTSYKSDEYAELLSKLMLFEGKGLTSEQLLDMFRQLTYRQLEYEGNTAMYIRSYYAIMNNVHDSALRSEMAFLYNYDLGRIYYNKKQYDKAMPCIEKAYVIKPKNNEVENLFFSLMGIKIEKGIFNKNDKEDLLIELESYKKSNPALEDNYTYKTFWLQLCLMLMDDAYYARDVEIGEKYRLLFEEAYPVPEYELRDLNDRIVHAYATAMGYYFQKGNYKMSRKMANKGLQYSPYNPILLERLIWLK